MKNNIKQFRRFNQELKKRIKSESNFAHNMTLDGETYKDNEYFGAYQTYYNLKGCIHVPSDWNDTIFEVKIDDSIDGDNAKNPQFKLFIGNKHVSTFDANHHIYRIKDKGMIDFHLEIFTGNSTAKFPVFVTASNINPIIEKLAFDIEVLTSSLEVIDTSDTNYYRIYEGIQSALKLIDVDSSSELLLRSAKKASDIIESLYLSNDEVPVLHSVAHTHIDIAWLWTVRQAIEKSERSFTTILNLMERYPEFTFIQSQPQLYEFIEEKNPELFQAIVEYVKRGQWEVEGGMWVEADTTLVSGESLVRQFLYGKTYFREKFGIDNKVLWLPDVFGYSASLPQIMKKSGIEYFMTTKLSWNQYNQIPYDSFKWKGIDGSEILTHFITTPGTTYQPRPWYTTYNGLLEVGTMAGSWERYQQKNINKDLLIAYGYGDGGGGPTEAMVETGIRLGKGIGNLPKVKFSKSIDFFETLKSNFKDKVIPKWQGELYFEYHRGTYTSRAENKRLNRKLENDLQSLEKLSVLYNHDIKDHDKMWKLLLLNQFHDIIPGTSIREVYEQTNKEYEYISTTINDNLVDMFNEGTSSYIFNPVTFHRDGILSGVCVSGALSQSDNLGNIISYTDNILSLQMKEIKLDEPRIQPFVEREASKLIETEHYTIQFNENFEIVSIIDKSTGRECVGTKGKFNELLLYEDLPMDYDAWDLDAYYDYKHWRIDNLISAQIVADGPIRMTLEIERKFSHSKIKQHIHFYKVNKLIEFESWVSWYENGKLLKVNFDLNLNAKYANFDIPFGVIERPLHNNTTWDQAQFEVNGQKWADVSEGNFGISLMNDSKYGYHAKENRFGLSLLRSSNEPYEHADQGEHYFKYALLPHEGDWKSAGIMKEAIKYNNPLMILKDVSIDIHQHIPNYESDHIYLDTIKKSEDGTGEILRFFEYGNSRNELEIDFGKKAKSVSICNLMEEIDYVLAKDVTSIKIPFEPFEIVTVKVEYYA